MHSTVYVCSMCVACALFEMRSENFVCACIHMLEGGILEAYGSHAFCVLVG